MHERLILLADPDKTAAEELREALGESWVLTPAYTGAAALELLQHKTFTALAVSLRLRDRSAESLLNLARDGYPGMVRCVIGAKDESDRLMDQALGAHQFLPRPFKRASVAAALETALDAGRWIPTEALRQLIGRMRSLPTVPALYLDIISCLNDNCSTTEDVGELIAKDVAITTKLLQVINSPYFGLARAVTSPSEAVGLLGFSTTQALVVAVELLSQTEHFQPDDEFAEPTWAHASAVARDAKTLAVLQTGEELLADECFAGGLLHDVGKAILAGDFPEQYREAERVAASTGTSLHTIEKEAFGAHHGEVGAYLLGLWSLPVGVVQAAAWHHVPGNSAQKDFSSLTAVHVADALFCVTRSKKGLPAPTLDWDYLKQTGTADCVPDWCRQILGAEAAARYLATLQAAEEKTSTDSGAATTVPNEQNSISEV